jgi:hypothetical protein
VDRTALDRAWAGRLVAPEALPVAPGDELGAWIDPYITWQASRWPQLARSLEGLAAVRHREVRLGGRRIRVQFNPGRAVSTTAKVDPASIRARPCFLCPANLPPEEKGLAFGGDWVLLANPFPILARHLVLAHREHRPQRARDAIATLLELSLATAGSVAVMFNGPAAGASAPDHLHLQTVQAGWMPEESTAWTVVDGADADFLLQRSSLAVWVVPGPGPVALAFHGELDAVARALHRSLDALGEVQGEPEEPRLNLVAGARDGGVLALLFPRQAHRPSAYHAEEPHRRLISPGAIDMGGHLITVRESDFEALDAEQIRTLYRETCIAPERLAALCALLERRIRDV